MPRIYVRLVKKTKNFLNNRRLSQLDVVFMNVAGCLTTDVIADEFADGGGEVKINGVYIFCDESILQGPVGGLPYFVCFFVQSEMIQQHGCGEDAAQGVSDVLTGGLGIGAVYGLEEGGSLTDGCRGKQTK